MIYAGILAAGIGARMHRQDMPKPFLPLGGKPIIIHTLEQFYINPRIDRLIIVAPDTWKLYAEDLIHKYGTMRKEVYVITGGENKTVSIQMIVKYIASSWGIHDGDLILTHDAVRPFVTQRMIDENIDTAEKYGAANTVMTTNDTIIVTQDGATLSEIPPKHIMLAAQTPQTYNLITLAEVFEKAAQEGIPLTLETELSRFYAQQGHTVRLIMGEYSNMKIINPYDLEVANALLKERTP